MIRTTAIKPKSPDQKAMMEALVEGMKDVGDMILDDFQATANTWKQKPSFQVKATVSEKKIAVEISTDDEVYGYVSGGTPAHDIEAKVGGVLAFQEGYVAKTFPGVILSIGGGPSGETAFARRVHHPGTKARNFPQVIARALNPFFTSRMREALAEAAQASGQPIER